MADRRSDESLGPKRLCKTEDTPSPPSAHVFPPAHVFPRILRTVIAAREIAAREEAKDLGCCTRTPDHLSVLVTAFLRRGKPRSGLKPSVRLERQASKEHRCSSEARTPSYRTGVALLIDRRERLTAARAAEKGRRALPSRNRLLSRRRNSVKGVVHTISGFGGKDGAATIQDTSSFAGPREFAAFLGLTPRQNSSGNGLTELSTQLRRQENAGARPRSIARPAKSHSSRHIRIWLRRKPISRARWRLRMSSRRSPGSCGRR